MKTNKISTFIGGKLYRLVGEESEAHLHKVSAFVNKKLEEVRQCESSYPLSMNQVAILTCVNITDEFMKEHEKKVKEISETTKKIESLEKENQLLRKNHDPKLVKSKDKTQHTDQLKQLVNEKTKESELQKIEITRLKNLLKIKEMDLSHSENDRKNLQKELHLSKKEINEIQSKLHTCQVELENSQKELAEYVLNFDISN